MAGDILAPRALDDRFPGLKRYATTAYATSGVILAAPGVLFQVRGFSSRKSAQWVQILDAAAVPADTSVPIHIIRVGPNENFFLDLGEFGDDFATGICWSTSSTGPTKTIGSADTWVSAGYN